MPNGYDRNWVRLRAAIAGFHVRFGRWPDRVRMPLGLIADLRDYLFSESAFHKLQGRVALIPDEEAGCIAQDDAGHEFDYGTEGFIPGWYAVDVAGWLGVQPDRHPLWPYRRGPGPPQPPE
jgi:hypothetical protein